MQEKKSYLLWTVLLLSVILLVLGFYALLMPKSSEESKWHSVLNFNGLNKADKNLISIFHGYDMKEIEIHKGKQMELLETYTSSEKGLNITIVKENGKIKFDKVYAIPVSEGKGSFTLRKSRDSKPQNKILRGRFPTVYIPFTKNTFDKLCFSTYDATITFETAQNALAFCMDQETSQLYVDELNKIFNDIENRINNDAFLKENMDYLFLQPQLSLSGFNVDPSDPDNLYMALDFTMYAIYNSNIREKVGVNSYDDVVHERPAYYFRKLFVLNYNIVNHKFTKVYDANYTKLDKPSVLEWINEGKSLDDYPKNVLVKENDFNLDDSCSKNNYDISYLYTLKFYGVGTDHNLYFVTKENPVYFTGWGGAPGPAFEDLLFAWRDRLIRFDMQNKSFHLLSKEEYKKVFPFNVLYNFSEKIPKNPSGYAQELFYE